MNREVVVIGGNHHNTLSILRSLGEKGIKSLLIVLSPYDPKPFVGYSKYIQKKIVVTNINEISSAMYSLHTTAEKAIVIACNDCISSYLDMNHNNLSKNAGTTERDGRNDAKRLCTNVVTVSDEVKPKKRKMQGKAEYSRRTVCKSLPKKM